MSAAHGLHSSWRLFAAGDSVHAAVMHIGHDLMTLRLRLCSGSKLCPVRLSEARDSWARDVEEPLGFPANYICQPRPSAGCCAASDVHCSISTSPWQRGRTACLMMLEGCCREQLVHHDLPRCTGCQRLLYIADVDIQ